MAQATLSWPSANSPCVRAKNRLDFVPALARAGSLRRWVLLYPKPSPRGEGGPAKPGRMRGRSSTQPFLVEIKKGGSRLSPQRNFSPAPLGNPVAPSSVTFGDSFPPRGSLWVVQLATKKRSKSGYADGYRISPSTVPLRPTTPKPASGNERPLNPGGAGGHPPRLFASGLSLEKAWIPRPGPGGNPPRRSGPAAVPTEPPAAPGTSRPS